MWRKKGSDECLRVTLSWARCEGGLGESKGKAVGEKDVMRPGLGVSLIPCPPLLPLWCPHPCRPLSVPPWGLWPGRLLLRTDDSG